MTGADAPSDVALVVIYNHRFDRNIEIVERIYAGKFSHIFHLVPFYDGDRPNVIPVYESSYHFEGYVAQGYRHFAGPFKHYFFVADDMVLNPAIDERSYASIFGLDDASGFLPELDPMPGGKWPHDRAAVTFDPYRPGIEIRNELPSREAAAAAIAALGVTNGRYPLRDTYFPTDDWRFANIVKQAIRYAYDRFVLKTDLRASKYPFVRSYSDIFIVSATHVKKFVQYCGAFAAAELWVELAIPTALVLSGENIRVQSQLRLQGRPLWSAEDLKLLDTFDYTLRKLLDAFPKDYLYLHPIKLSKWNTD